MPQVPAAALARHFRAHHAVGLVHVLLDLRLRSRLGEARPAAARVELLARAEQFLAAAGAAIRALGMVVPILAGESALGPLLAQHVVLLGRQALAPILLARLLVAHGVSSVRLNAGSACSASGMTASAH